MPERDRAADLPTFHGASYGPTDALDVPAAYERCTFQGTRLASRDLSRCRFVDCTFRGADLSAARLDGCVLQGTTFSECKLLGIDWSTVERVASLAFTACLLDGSSFVGMRLATTVFAKSRAKDAVFADTDLAEADLKDADLTGAVFLRTKLAGADLRGARGYAIDARVNDLRGAKVSLPEAAAILLATGIDVVA